MDFERDPSIFCICMLGLWIGTAYSFGLELCELIQRLSETCPKYHKGHPKFSGIVS